MTNRSEFSASQFMQEQAETRAQWAAVLAPTKAPKRAPVQRKQRGFLARLFAR